MRFPSFLVLISGFSASGYAGRFFGLFGMCLPGFVAVGFAAFGFWRMLFFCLGHLLRKLDENLAPVKLKCNLGLKQIDGKFFFYLRLESGKEVLELSKTSKRYISCEFNKNNQFFGVIVFSICLS
ncbi:hypothetical protein HYE28_01975 [Mycoplasmopsis bovis]|nr:hypothetical protein [Mycoplasmopsis bovis]QQH23019.1 hypothetical protein HYE28_01975 [Mycoplasmopsis bovis]